MEKLLLQNFTPNILCPTFRPQKLKQTSSDNILLNKKGAEKKIMFQNWNWDFLQFFTLAFCQWNQKHSFFLRMLNSYMSNKILNIEEKNIYIYKMQSH